MEMEFKDNSRRRTLVLVVGVLLALGAGAAAFMLSSQSGDEPVETIPTHDIVVAAQPIPARATINRSDLTLLTVPRDVTNETALTDPDAITNKIAAISILANQPITPNMLAQAVGVGQIDILEPDATVNPESPVLRAVSLTVPTERAVGGLIGADQRVDVIATMPMNVTLPFDSETGLAAVDPETGEPISFTSGTSTKLMWLDLEIIARPEGSPELYIMRTDLQTAEEIALAQNVGAQFTMALRPAIDTRDVDRSSYGETQDRLMTRYNFPIPEIIDGLEYPQPEAFPTPYPAEPYLDLTAASPEPEDALIEIPIDEELAAASPAPEAETEP